MAHLMSSKTHEKLVNLYFREMARPSVAPTRFERVGVSQVFNADKEVFIHEFAVAGMVHHHTRGVKYTTTRRLRTRVVHIPRALVATRVLLGDEAIHSHDIACAGDPIDFAHGAALTMHAAVSEGPWIRE